MFNSLIISSNENDISIKTKNKWFSFVVAFLTLYGQLINMNYMVIGYEYLEFTGNKTQTMFLNQHI
jgi:hypothetical protein